MGTRGRWDSPRSRFLRPVPAAGSHVQVSAVLPTAGITDLSLGHARPRGGGIGFVQLDVTPRQEARLNNHGMDTSPWRTDTREFYRESVHANAWLPAVERPHSKVYVPKKVRIGYAADVAVLGSWEGIHIRRNLVAAHVQACECPGRVMIHKVHMTEEPAVLASCHETKVRVVATVGKRLIRDDESPAGREVAWERNHVSVYGGAAERQQAHQQSTR